MYKVLHLTHTDIRSDSRILKEMAALASQETEYKVYGIGIQSSSVSTPNANRDTSGINICSVPLYSRGFWLPRLIRHMLSFVEVFVRMIVYGLRVNPDVIHCNDNLMLPIAVVLKLLTRSRLIYDAHELESDKNGLSNIAKKLILFEEKLLWRFVDFLIVVSPSIDNWYQKHLGSKPSEVILNSPVLTSEAIEQAQKNYFRQHFSIPEDKTIFLYVGGLCQGRGLDLIIDAFTSGNHDAHVVFLGYGEKFDDLKSLSSTHMNLHVHEAVPHHRVVELAKSADVGLCLIQNISLSDYYCLPNKLFEYIFSGIPVLASKFPDISMLVNTYNVGRCCELSVEAIVEGIKEFEGNTPLVDTRNLYELSWRAQEDKLRSLYNNLLQPQQVVE